LHFTLKSQTPTELRPYLDLFFYRIYEPQVGNPNGLIAIP
jgi:hypothetical protein